MLTRIRLTFNTIHKSIKNTLKTITNEYLFFNTFLIDLTIDIKTKKIFLRINVKINKFVVNK